ATGPNVGTVLPKGEQTITLQVSSGFGCTSTISQDYLVVGPEGDFIFEPDTICAGQSVLFGLQDTVDVDSWTWLFGDGTEETDVDPVVHEYLIEPPAGFTTIRLVLSGEQGQCETTVEQNLFYDAINVDFIRNDGLDTAICFGPYPLLENTTNADQFVWDFGDGNFTVGSAPIHEYDQPGTYEVQLTATNTSIGCVDSITKTVILLPNPTPLIEGFEIRLGESGQLVLLNPNAGSTYSWSPAESLSDSTSLFPFASPATETIYTITEIDELGCIGTDTAVVDVRSVRPVYIPNAFSPNGDGVNDLFMIFSSGAVRQVNNFQVYDRWGELVYSAQNFFPNDPTFGWDGRLKGQLLTPGVFVFFAEVEFIDDEVFFYKGDVTLLR
ncbi:MAG: PKD domain-containing protein, partial [Bacteroidota bacterium]